MVNRKPFLGSLGGALAVASVLALLVAACAPAAPPAPTPAPTAPAGQPSAAPAAKAAPTAAPAWSIGTPDRPLRIATSPAIPFVPVYATMEQLRKKYGLTVNFVEIPASAERTLALVRGDIDIYTGGIATLLTQIERGEPIALFMNTGTLGTGIVARKDITDWNALKGQQVETIRGSIMHMQLLGEMEKHGLSSKDVQLKFTTRPQDMNADLKQGQVAAVSGIEPFLSEAVVDGYGRFLSFPYDTEVGWRAQGTWAAQAGFLKAHADVVQLMVDENAALLKRYHEQPSTFLDDTMRLLNFKADYKPVVEASLHNLALPLAFDSAGVKDIEGTARFMVQFNQLKAVPNLDRAIDMSFVTKAEQKLGWQAPQKLYSLLTPPAWDPAYTFPTR